MRRKHHSVVCNKCHRITIIGCVMSVLCRMEEYNDKEMYKNFGKSKTENKWIGKRMREQFQRDAEDKRREKKNVYR